MENNDNTEKTTENTTDVNNQSSRPKKIQSGDYYYASQSEQYLSKAAFICTALVCISMILQLIVLCFPQAGSKYVSEHMPSYAYVYIWTVFITLAANVYAAAMSLTRRKITKRILANRAPRRGFKYRTFFCYELLCFMSLVLFAIELSFVCICYDGWTLAAVFITALALAAAVCARQFSHNVLKTTTLIRAEPSEKATTEPSEKATTEPNEKATSADDSTDNSADANTAADNAKNADA